MLFSRQRYVSFCSFLFGAHFKFAVIGCKKNRPTTRERENRTYRNVRKDNVNSLTKCWKNLKKKKDLYGVHESEYGR